MPTDSVVCVVNMWLSLKKVFKVHCDYYYYLWLICDERKKHSTLKKPIHLDLFHLFHLLFDVFLLLHRRDWKWRLLYLFSVVLCLLKSCVLFHLSKLHFDIIVYSLVANSTLGFLKK